MAHEVELTAREKHLRETYTESVPLLPGGYKVALVVDNQQFHLDQEFELDEAEWSRDMLAKALAKMIFKESL